MRETQEGEFFQFHGFKETECLYQAGPWDFLLPGGKEAKQRAQSTVKLDWMGQ